MPHWRRSEIFYWRKQNFQFLRNNFKLQHIINLWQTCADKYETKRDLFAHVPITDACFFFFTGQRLKWRHVRSKPSAPSFCLVFPGSLVFPSSASEVGSVPIQNVMTPSGLPSENKDCDRITTLREYKKTKKNGEA